MILSNQDATLSLIPTPSSPLHWGAKAFCVRKIGRHLLCFWMHFRDFEALDTRLIAKNGKKLADFSDFHDLHSANIFFNKEGIFLILRFSSTARMLRVMNGSVFFSSVTLWFFSRRCLEGILRRWSILMWNMLSDSQLVHTLFKHLLSRLFWFDAAHERANRCWVRGVYVWANFWGTREMVDFQDFSTSTRILDVHTFDRSKFEMSRQ